MNFSEDTSRLFDKTGKSIKARSHGDLFRELIIKTVLQQEIKINSVLDVGCGLDGGFGKGLARILKVSNLYQMDIEPERESDIHFGDVLQATDFPDDRFGLGLLVQVLRSLEPYKVETAISNVMANSDYSIITTVDAQIMLLNGDYFGSYWMDKEKGFAGGLSTCLFDGTVYQYSDFYVQDKDTIEDIISKNGKVICYKSYLYRQAPIYHLWITENKRS